MDAKDQIISTLGKLKSEIKTKYRVKEIGLFGSIVRGEQRETSDVDVLVEFDESASLFDLVGLAIFLEEKLNRKVDVVSKRALRPELRESILREAATI